MFTLQLHKILIIKINKFTQYFLKPSYFCKEPLGNILVHKRPIHLNIMLLIDNVMDER